MRTWFYLCVGIVLTQALGSAAQTDQGKEPEKAGMRNGAPSRIVKVTVYPSSALVTREVEVPKGNGLIELTVSDLPTETVENSLYAEGSNGIRVLTTRYRVRPVQHDTREEVRKLNDEMKKQQLTLEKIDADIKTIEQNLQAINKLENFTDKTTSAVAEKGSLNSDAVVKLMTFVMAERAEKTKELVKLRQSAKALNEQSEFLQRKLSDVSSGNSNTERDAILVVDRSKATGGKVRLNYLVNSVSWSPQYKLRAGKADEDVQMDYLASLVQRTGEDWSNVELTLSNAPPMIHALPPDLKKLEVSVIPRGMALATILPNMTPPMQVREGPYGAYPVNPPMYAPASSPRKRDMLPPLPGEDFVNPKSPEELAKDATEYRQKAHNWANEKKDVKEIVRLINEAAAFDQTRELTKTVQDLASEKLILSKGVKVCNEGPSVAYHLQAKISVPSRNDEQVLEVAKIQLKPKYYYKAVPLLNPNVYRLANLTNKSPYVLLPGEATMYQGSDFVGRMAMPRVAIDEEFTAGFGIDPQFQVQRKMMDKARATQGGNQVLKYEYRILVNSYKTEVVKIQVWDRLPHSDMSEAAYITLVKSAPELSKESLYVRESRPQNLLRWDLDVEPGMNGEKALTINYEFRIELDRQKVISSFTTDERGAPSWVAPMPGLNPYGPPGMPVYGSPPPTSIPAPTAAPPLGSPPPNAPLPPVQASPPMPVSAPTQSPPDTDRSLRDFK